MDYNFNISGMLVAVALFVHWLFIDEVIRSTEPITPEIELIINDNEVDTIYVYRSN